MTEAVKFEGWAILELMGHVRLAGRVSPAPMFGTELVRIDIPSGDGYTTQFASGSSLYRLTPCSEEVARAVAGENAVMPIESWEIRRIERAQLPPARQEEPSDGERFEMERDARRFHELLHLRDHGGLTADQEEELAALAEDTGLNATPEPWPVT
jgi:hypothetical protein